MPAAPRCSAVSPAAICGRAARRIALPPCASSATPTSWAPTVRAAASSDAEGLAEARRSLWPAGRAGARFVVVTGGEPLLQLDVELVDALQDRRFVVAVETNGTISPPRGIDWVCVSPKAGADLSSAAATS